MYTSVFHPEKLLGKMKPSSQGKSTYEISNTRLGSKGSLIQGPSHPFLDQTAISC